MIQISFIYEKKFAVYSSCFHVDLIQFNRAVANNRNIIHIIIEYEFLIIMTVLFAVIGQMLIITNAMHKIPRMIQ